MKLLKDNTYNFEPFHVSLQKVSKYSDDTSINNYFVDSPSTKLSNMLEKQAYFIQNLISFEKQINSSADLKSISAILKLALRRVLAIKEANIFFFDELKSSLIPFDNDFENRLAAPVNSFLKEGILEIVFEKQKPSFLPEFNNFTQSGSKLNYLFIPVIEGAERKGLLCILTPVSKEDFTELDSQSIQLILGTGLAKVDKLRLKEKLNSTLGELQTYQAKLSNDFRLSAIGELTDGIVEDIKTPLQVILSYADMLEKEEGDQDVAKAVKEQVKKINYLVHRLVKFSSVNEEKIKIYPCDINQTILEYYNLVKSSLETANIECVLDFERDLPSILSHPSFIYQLLGNIISIIKSESNEGGGIIFQTRCVNENVVVKLINTAVVQPYKMKPGAPSTQLSNLNYKIIENLMKQHEGEFSIDVLQKSSSVVTLKFPIRRKSRK